jgi:mono/diheme cytochrome c family protein
VGLLGGVGCELRRSVSGLRLPQGDVERGRRAFVDMKCYACHLVDGVDMPAPFAEPPVQVVLGEGGTYLRTDGELLTSITNPSRAFVAGYPPEAIKTGRRSRMGHFNTTMTVEQLVDIVAFLQSRYEAKRSSEAGSHTEAPVRAPEG